MKTNRNFKIAGGVVFLLVFVLNFSSCDYLIQNENLEDARISEVNKKIKIDQSEAKLLVMVSKDNLDVIELCSIIEEEQIDDSVKNLVENIKVEHIEILEKFNKVATENIISIPDYSNIKKEKENLVNSEDISDRLMLLKNKINNQIELLEQLSDTSNNKIFIELAKNANFILRENLIKTKKSLRILNTDS